MQEKKPLSNDDVYDEWKSFIEKRNKFYGVKKKYQE